MDKKGVLIPLILAFIASFLYFAALNSKQAALTQGLEKVKVLVANQDLPSRTVIKDDLVDVMEIPRLYVAQDAYEYRNSADKKVILNLVTQIRIPKGNQLVKSALMSLNPKAGLSVKVPPGYRGAILGVSNDLLHLIKPGDRVDVLVTFDAQFQDRKEKVTATILQNVLVLGVAGDLGQGMNARDAGNMEKAEENNAGFSDKGVLSLALNPREAQYLALSERLGETTVVVRGLGDLEMHPMEMASFRKLFR
jgi:pilus assembly protein CpaB